MVITIASGKGGTGKTTIAANLAKTASELHSFTWLIDCDVEEPNAALFLDPLFQEEKKVKRLLPVINQQLCTGCGVCTEICEYNALAVAGGKALFFRELCHACGSCSKNCLENAIQESEEEIGVIQKGRSEKLNFAQGILQIGFSSPTPVIRDLKKWVINNESQLTTYFLDSSPGTSCPVVESFRGSDFALLVTEPTPFGLHDLKLVVQMLDKAFHIPRGIVINKSGSGDEIIEAFAREKKIPILMKIPLSREIAEAYARGELIIEAFPRFREEFKSLFKRISQEKKAKE